jgi:hypothetical protein
VLAAETFSTLHIGLTGLLVGVLSVPVAAAMLRTRSVTMVAAVFLVAMLATFGYRLCANVTPLNTDGVPGFSANDLLAPAFTYLLLGIYESVVPPADSARFAKLRAAVVGVALVVNVVTI